MNYKLLHPSFYCDVKEHTLLHPAARPHTEMTKLLSPHHEGAGAPHPIRAGGPDLWYQMVLVDTTVEQSLISSAEGIRGSECVRFDDGFPRGGKGWRKE